MSERVTVKEVGEGRPWQHGVTYWDVTFDRSGANFGCVWGKKEGPPQLGEEVEGEFFQKDGEWRFRKALKLQGDGSYEGSTGSSGSKNAGRSGRDLDASIARQVALKVLAPRINAQGLDSDVKKAVEEVEQFILSVGQTAVQAGAASHPPGGSGSGSQGASPATPPPEQQPVSFEEEHRLLTQMLETAAVAAYPAEKLARWALENLNPESLKESRRELSDLETQRAGVKRLRKAYENKEGPLPESGPAEEEIPF